MTLVALPLLMACSGGDDEDSSTQSVTMPAETSSMLVTLEKLNEPIETASSLDGWLNVTIMLYTSGTPVIKLAAETNSETKDRRTKVVIMVYSGKSLELNVIQKASSSTPSGNEKTGDIYDVVTDQPAHVSARKERGFFPI